MLKIQLIFFTNVFICKFQNKLTLEESENVPKKVYLTNHTLVT